MIFYFIVFIIVELFRFVFIFKFDKSGINPFEKDYFYNNNKQFRYRSEVLPWDNWDYKNIFHWAIKKKYKYV